MLALGKLLELTLAAREPSEKIQVCASGARLQWRAEGVLEIDPPAGHDSGFDLLLSAGIHGDESAPVELLGRLLHDIAACRLQPSARLLLVLGNPAALRRGERFVECDLNRLFGGLEPSASGPEALRAVELELQVELFFGRAERRRLHLDLHAAHRASRLASFALRPWNAQRPTRERLAGLQAAGLQALLLQDGPSASFAAFSSSRCGAEALTVELGPGTPAAPLEAWLRALIEGREATLGGDPAALTLFRVARELVKRSDAFRFHPHAAPENFSELLPGSLLAEDGDGRSWLVEEAGARIVFANPRVANGQRAGLVVVPVALDEVCG